MAKKPTTTAASDRQAKIQAAQKSQGCGRQQDRRGDRRGRRGDHRRRRRRRLVAEPEGGGHRHLDGGARRRVDGQGLPRVRRASRRRRERPRSTSTRTSSAPSAPQFEAALGSTFQGLAQEGKLKLNYHVLNFLDDKTGAKNSTPAANGAFCAAADGKFQEFHNAVFASQVAEGKDVTDAELGRVGEPRPASPATP